MEVDHTKNRHTNNSKTVNCNKCEIKFANKRSLSTHNSKFHKSKTNKSYTKSIKSDESDNSSVHSSSHKSKGGSENDEQKTQLELDNFNSQNELKPTKRHDVTKMSAETDMDHHTDISKTATCNKCQIQFLNKRSLSTHKSKFHQSEKRNDLVKIDQNIPKTQEKIKRFNKPDSKRKGYSPTISTNDIKRMKQGAESDFSHTGSQSDASNDMCTSLNDSGYESEGSVDDKDVSDNESKQYKAECSPSKWTTQSQRDAHSFKDFFKFKIVKDGVGLNQTESSLVDSIMLIDNLDAVVQLMEGNPKVVKTIFTKVRRYSKQDGN